MTLMNMHYGGARVGRRPRGAASTPGLEQRTELHTQKEESGLAGTERVRGRTRLGTKVQLAVCRAGKVGPKMFNPPAKYALAPSVHMVWKAGMLV